MLSANPYWRLVRDNRDFRRLYLAQIISFGGDWFLTVPLLGLIFEMTGSALATGAVLAVQALPTFLLAPLAGMAADRFDRKVIMIAADLGRMVVVLGLLLVDDLGSPLLAFALVGLVSVGTAFFFPASSSALPNLVEGRQLAPANVLLGSAWGTMAAVGSAVGGTFAATLGRDASFTVDSLTYLASAVLIVRIARPFAEPSAGRRPGFLHSAREAIDYARAHPEVAALLTSKAGFGITGGALVLLPVISFQLFGTGDQGTGVLFGARGLGVLLGPFLVKRLLGDNDRRLVGSIGYSMAAWGVCYSLLSVAPTLALAALAVMAGHMGGGNQWVMSTYGLQVLTPDFVRGRIFSFDFGLVMLSISASYLLAGSLSERLGVQPVLLGAGLLAMAFGLTWRRITNKYWEALEPAPPRA
ncbi:MAG: MFS transporter [Actinomycetota bacterium]|nr:MFS transporter [Actinomycetota bacterium]